MRRSYFFSFYNFISLTNLSNNIRWSLDLRWQRPDKPNGFYGIKDSVLMRKEGDPNYKPNWDEFESTDHHSVAKVSFEAKKYNLEQNMIMVVDED